MGLALISYGTEEAADTLIEQMAREQVGSNVHNHYQLLMLPPL
jgi:hypothetical protein